MNQLPLDQNLESLAPKQTGSTEFASELPRVTLFALPKAFKGDADRIQKNAFRSWLQLAPYVELILIGDDEGIEQFASSNGIKHVGGIRTNAKGTPLISSAFEAARQHSRTPLLAYCNSDVILTKDFVDSLERLLNEATFDQFVAIGQRIDLDVTGELDFENARTIDSLVAEAKSQGKTSSAVCKEYFIFNRDLYQNLPDFAVGRGNWDNWMVYSAKQSRVPVVNLSGSLTAIHQAHDYSHFNSNRYQCYVAGEEAQENMRLAGGRHLISGSTCTWKLTSNRLRREPPLLLNPAFWGDIPRFVRLMLDLISR